MKRLLCCLTFLVHHIAMASSLTIAEVDVDKISKQTPALPSLAPYTRSAMEEKLLDYNKVGEASLERLVGHFETLKFYRLGLISEWAKRQGEFPKAIFVRNGKVSLNALHEAAPDALIKDSSGNYIARVPIIVSHDGVLVLEKNSTLLLSQQRGAFLINAGIMFAFDSEISAWNEQTQSYAKFSGDKKTFRPFITSMGGTKTYFAGSEFHSLGYESQKSYGLSLITHTESTLDKVTEEVEEIDPSASPTGWLINNKFVDLYFGFFSYEAEDVAIVGNHYVDNVVYGIDPHDRSKRLIIANNIVQGAKQKHGIIISREVNDSFIFGNVTFDNNRSGIMLDRSCENNIVAQNRVYNNGGDGITFYESGHNIVWNNKVYENEEHGIRIRNSVDIHLAENVVVANKGSAVYFHTRDLSDHTYRDLQLDPYQMKVSGSVIGGLLAYNESGSIHGEDILSVSFANLSLQKNGSTKGSLGMTGDFALHQTTIVQKLWSKQSKGVLLERSEEE